MYYTRSNIIWVGFILFGFLAASQPRVVSTEYIAKGQIVIPDEHEGAELFSVIHNGVKRFSDSEGFFSFTFSDDETSVNEQMKQALAGDDSKNRVLQAAKPPSGRYYLLITKQVDGIYDGNTVAAFRHDNKRPYLYVSFDFQNDATVEAPHIKAEELVAGAYDPERTFIVLMNPKRVKRLSYWPVKLSGQFLQLPRIELKGQDEVFQNKQNKYSIEEARERAKKNTSLQGAKSVMTSLDLASFHDDPPSLLVLSKNSRGNLVEVRSA
jgi:hypothetical protein